MNLLSKIPQFFYSPDAPPGLGGNERRSDITIGGQTVTNERSAFDIDLGDKKAPNQVEKPDGEVEKPKADKPDSSDGEAERESGEPEDKSEESEAEAEDESDELLDEETQEELEDEEEDEEVTAANAKIDEQLSEDTVYEELKKLDKDIFKKVPGLREIVFRERELTTIFPTVDDAKAAAKAAKVLQGFETDLMSGNSQPLIEVLEKSGKDKVEGFLANFIPTVKKHSKDFYLGIVAPEIKEFLKFARGQSDKNIQQSAENLHWLMFGDLNFEAKTGFQPKTTDEREETYKKKEKELLQRQYDSFQKSVGSSVEARAKRIINLSFKDSGFSKWQQDKMVEDIFSRVGKSLGNDPRHMGNMNRLWSDASEAGFTREWEDRITNAFLSRAKALIPKHRQAVLAEAKASALTSKNGEKKKKAIRVSGTESSKGVSRQGSIDPKKVDWKKTDERDLLDPDAKIHYRS